MLVVFDKIANTLSKLEDVLIHCGPHRSQQFLSYGYIYSLSHGDIAPVSDTRPPRTLIYCTEKLGGGKNGTYWVLFHTCPGLKKHFWYIWVPVGKN